MIQVDNDVRGACLTCFTNPGIDYTLLSDAQIAEELVNWLYKQNLSFKGYSENTGLYDYIAVFSDEAAGREYGAESNSFVEAVMLAALRIFNIVKKPSQSWSVGRWEIA